MNYKVCRNAMELLVSEEIDRQIASSDEFDTQTFERCDAIAYALNRLPALYATTEEGWKRQVDRAHRQLHAATRDLVRAVEVAAVGE